MLGDTLAALTMAERAYATLDTLGLPRPAEVPLQLSPPASSDTCVIESALTQAVLEASFARTAAAAAERRVLVESFLELASPCGDFAVRARRQADAAHLERGWPRRAASFLGWLDARFGTAGPGRLLAAMTTRLASANLFAVLRENLKDAEFSRSTLADSIAAFGLGQALAPEASATWNIPWPSTPRALLLPAVDPFGAAVVELQVPPSAPSLRVETEWEQHAEMRVAVVGLDAERHVLSTSWVAGRSRITEANATFVPQPATRYVRVVVLHVDDPFEPLDPRRLPFEPHAALVTLAGLP